VHRKCFASAAEAEATIAALRSATDQVRAVSETPEGPEFELVGVTPEPRESRASRTIERAALRASASHWPSKVPYLLDGDLRTRWLGVANAESWVRIELDRPRDVASVRIELGRASYGDPPLELRIESEEGGVTRVLHEASVLPVLVQALLREPLKGVVEIDLPPNRTTALVLRHPRPARWAVGELELRESATTDP
jgi:hypothetical protein